MNDMKKTVLWLSLFGFALGIGIGLLFYSLASPDAFLAQTDKLPARLMYFLLCGLFGAVNMGTSAVYGIEEWSVLRCTVSHFLISAGSTVAFFAVMIAYGWMDMPSAGVCALIAAAFVLVYFMIWLMQYLAYKRKVKKLNARLREWKAQRKR